MLGVTHVLFSSTLYLSLRLLGVHTTLDLGFAAMILGSLFPDIDHPRGLLASSGLVQHRGIIHGLPASMLFAAVGYGITDRLGLSPVLATAFWFGYVTHLLADSLTKSGIKWFQPFSDRRTNGPIVTGSAGELGVFLILILVDGYVVFFT